MILLLIGLALPILVIFIVTRRALGDDAAGTVLAAGIATGLGTGLAAAGFSVWRFVAPDAWFSAWPIIDGAVWCVAGLLAVRTRSTAARPESFTWTLITAQRLMLLAVVGITVASVTVFAVHTIHMPHGDWDAWAFWNIKARYMVRGDVAHWQNLFRSAITHPGYPHLLPAAVARLWMWSGSETVAGPIGIAILFTYGTVAVLIGALARFRGWTAALWGGLLCLGAAPLTLLGSQQTADVPLGFFVLTAVVLMMFDLGEARLSRFAVLGGAATGLAAYTKDEGLPFLLGMLVVYGGFRAMATSSAARTRLKRFALFAIATVPIWLLLAVIHARATPTGFSQALLERGTYGKVLDPSRHVIILKGFALTMLTGYAVWPPLFGPTVAAFAVVGGWKSRVRVDLPSALCLSALAIMIASYYVALLVTPYDLSWHIGSLPRVLVQVWPTFVLVLCLLLRFDTAAPVPVKES